MEGTTSTTNARREPVAQVRAILADRACEVAVLTHAPAVRWVTGFTGSNGLVAVRAESVHFATDGRYVQQARQQVAEGIGQHTTQGELMDALVDAGFFAAGDRVLVQGDHTTVAQLEAWQERLPTVGWSTAKGWLDVPMARKAEREVEAMRRALRITEAVYGDVLHLLREGVTEQDLAAEVVYGHLRRGAERMAFDPIVAFGANAALPHARPTARALKHGDVVLLDMGGFVDGYASDMTRTVAFGTPRDPDVQAVYRLVAEAQAAALDAAVAGLSAAALDQTARRIIDDGGYGEAFTHSLGHGVGLEIHEWPRISSRSEEPVPAGAVVTIEPGVYLPGRFGVRIEDMIWVHENGCENLTRAPKTWQVL